MPAFRNVTPSVPRLSPSQVQFRLGLVRQRTRSYPMDSMDFIMMDLERPERAHRHAHQCTGDLTGRLLELLSHADGVDGLHDERLPVLFERILRQRRPSGLFGRAVADPPSDQDLYGACARYFPGLIRYYELTNDARALEAAVDLADLTVRSTGAWRRKIDQSGGRAIELWITEPMAMLYGITGKRDYMDFVGMVNEGLEMPDKGAHAHGYMATLRGLQAAALITGDAAWNEKAEAARKMIIERRFELPDGCTPECFPDSGATEGCSIADWLMLNLNSGALSGREEAYAHAEHVMWNALAFNQWITGSFGIRSTAANGYGMRRFEEAWWCCLHHGGLALTEYARHAVTLRANAIQVNLLVPGLYRLALADGREATVRITTSYPARAEALVEVEGAPRDMAVRLRVPPCVKRPDVSEAREGGRVRVRLSGRLGHHVEPCHGGILMKYGPLVLSPAVYSWQRDQRNANEDYAPAGYIPDRMPEGLPALRVPAPDRDGLLALSDLPQPDWMFFDEGPGARCGVEGAAANVPVAFPDGGVKTLRFTPLCYNTSNLSLFDTPIVFGAGGGRDARKA